MILLILSLLSTLNIIESDLALFRHIVVRTVLPVSSSCLIDNYFDT